MPFYCFGNDRNTRNACSPSREQICFERGNILGAITQGKLLDALRKLQYPKCVES